MVKKSRKKPRFAMMRFRRNDPSHNLRAAVRKYVHANGGTITVIGGIEFQAWGESAAHFRVAIRCLGQKPPAKEAKP